MAKSNSRIDKAIEFAVRFGGIDGDHHKAWVIDQMVRALTGCPMVKYTGKGADGEPYTCDIQGESLEYKQVVADACEDGDDPNAYEWEIGIPP